MALRGRRLRRVAQVPDSESDEDERVVADSPSNVGPIDLSDDEDTNAASPPRVHIPQQVPEARLVNCHFHLSIFLTYHK